MHFIRGGLHCESKYLKNGFYMFFFILRFTLFIFPFSFFPSYQGKEGQSQQFIVRATFSSFSGPSLHVF